MQLTYVINTFQLCIVMIQNKTDYFQLLAEFDHLKIANFMKQLK